MWIYWLNVVFGSFNMVFAIVEKNWSAAGGWFCSVLGWSSVIVREHKYNS